MNKRIMEIRNKTVFETGDPKHYIRAADIAYLIVELDKRDQQIKKLKEQVKKNE